MSGEGPSKAAPGFTHTEAAGHGEPLDDIILGDDEPAEPLPPVAPKPSTPPPLRPRAASRPSIPPSASVPPPAIKKDRSSDQVAVDAKAEAQRKRAKLTLRIPDDEISRPNLPPTTPVGGVVSASRPPSAPEVMAGTPRGAGEGMVSSSPRPMTGPPPPAFSADDTIELPSDALRARLAALTGDAALKAPAVGIDPSSEPGWTPFQPEVEDDIGPPIKPTPIVELRDPPNGGHIDPRGTVLDVHEVHNSSPPISEDIPVDMDLPEPSSDELATRPRLPLDSEEIRIDEGDRISETGEVEVSADDLVSVESLPSPVHHPPPVKTAGKYPAFKEAAPAATLVAPVATSSRQQVSVSFTNTPSQPPVAQIAPVVVPPVASVSAPHAQVTSSPGPAARRQSNPLVFVPPVGALAPPPMTDTAAMRKKTRPWWEELFNDDFIRTMAKVTDAQIGKEVNFIEESLGCEAGAMILDLACGTGRHAVELAARGYQVVGFDLSLAMLARASDEAQDRKQKINFVQGDMREMTFEETFDGVYSWNTSFGYFDEEKNGAVIARVHKALKKGGQFLLDVVNRDYIVRQAPSLAWFEGDGCICMDEMTIDFITSRMKVKRTLMMDDGRTKEIEYSIRTYALHELGKMLHDNGFRVAEVSGRTGTPGVFFGCESPRTL
ncbi:MAG: methyltransferase, partial [Labilithrix sp.]|nr:methyltransferase [Labilithrix sp.]